VSVLFYLFINQIRFTCKIYLYLTVCILQITIKRKKYKRTGGNTTTLHNHLKSKHPSKVEAAEAENTGEMDKFLKNDIPVSIHSLFFIKIFLYFNKILIKIFSVLLQVHFENFLLNGSFVTTNPSWL
jgi:hypothetical protein